MSIKFHSRKFITPPLQVMFSHIHAPDTSEFGKNKYHISLRFAKDDSEILSKMTKVMESVAQDTWGAKVDLSKVHMPIRDGDTKNEARTEDGKKEVEALKANFFIEPKSTNAPGFVNAARQDLDPSKDLRAGNIVRVQVVAKAYKSPTVGKGITLYLEHVQKLEEGTPIGGESADTAFDDDVSAEYASRLPTEEEVAA